MKTNNLAVFILIIFVGILCMSSNESEGHLFQDRNNSEIDTSKLYSHIRKALERVSKQQKQEVKANIDAAEAICAKENIEFPALLHLARAEYFFLTGDYRNALAESTIAQKKSDMAGDNYVLAKTMNFLGRYNLRTGFIKESIEYLNRSNDLAKKYRMKGFLPRNYDDLAEDYFALGNTKEFRNNLQLVIESAWSENDSVYLEKGYWKLGTSWSDKERDFHMADSLLRRCLEIALKRKDTTFVSLSWANLGWNFYSEKKYSSAINCYNKSLAFSVPAKLYNNSSNSYGNLGTIYRDLGETEKSLQYYNRAIGEGKLGKDIYNLSWVYHDMSEMYLRKRDTANAYKNFVMFKTFNDSLLTTSNIKGLKDAKIRYDAESENKELMLLSLRIKNQKLLIYGYTGLFVLSLAIGILIFNRSKINAKRRMSEMNRRIAEITQANLRQQMNPHFIFNTLNSIQYYMYQHDKLATNNYLTKFSSLMRKVLENSQHTSIPLRDELDALKLYLELEMIRFKDKFDYEIKVDEEIDSILYKVPTMLIQPYVENSISHGLMPCEGKGLVKIHLKLENEYISCTIEDNGIGREASEENKKRINHSSLGTQIVTSRLELVNALYGTSLKTIYTDLKNLKGEPEGTLVEIQIPILT